VDYSLFKEVRLRERLGLQFRGKFFNLFNHPQFDLPKASIGNPAALAVVRRTRIAIIGRS
jgi:hypothetical protein